MKIEIEVRDLNGFYEFFYQNEDTFDSYGNAEKDLNRILKQLKKLKKEQPTPQDAS